MLTNVQATLTSPSSSSETSDDLDSKPSRAIKRGAQEIAKASLTGHFELPNPDVSPCFAPHCFESMLSDSDTSPEERPQKTMRRTKSDDGEPVILMPRSAEDYRKLVHQHYLNDTNVQVCDTNVATRQSPWRKAQQIQSHIISVASNMSKAISDRVRPLVEETILKKKHLGQHELAKRHDEIASSLQQALELNPNNGMAWAMLASATNEEGTVVLGGDVYSKSECLENATDRTDGSRNTRELKSWLNRWEGNR